MPSRTPFSRDEPPQRRGGSFFGRRKGKALRPGQRQALETALPSLLVDLSRPAPENLTTLFTVPVVHIYVEIGFGGGEHLLSEARAHPDVGFIGIEPFRNGMAKAVTAIAREDIQNIRLFDQDAATLLDWLPADSVTRIDLLFPDPWPKRRHAKRRFVNTRNLDRIARCLAPGGCLRFATDVESYAEEVRSEVAHHAGLVRTRTPAEESQPWQDWTGTRYEAKAIAAGRAPAYLTLRKPVGEP